MMQYIEHILYLAKDYWLLSVSLGFIASFLESFVPALPLMAIAAVNAAINGFIVGFLTSWLGSCVGTIAVFYIIKRIFNTNFFQRHFVSKIREKLEEMIKKVKKSEFKALFVFYAIPVLPSSLLTLASAVCEIEYKVFIPPMMFGKFLMMFWVSYVGSDIKGFIRNPLKIAVVLLITIGSYIVANKMKKDMETHEDSAIIGLKRIKQKRMIKHENNKMIMKYYNNNNLSKRYISDEIRDLIRRLLEIFKKKEGK